MALFSKRHYAYLTSVMRDETRIAKLTGSAERIDQQQMIVARLAQALSDDNPAFDADQFFIYCDLPQLVQSLYLRRIYRAEAEALSPPVKSISPQGSCDEPREG